MLNGDADGRPPASSVYGPVITKFSRTGNLPHFFSYGAPPTRAARGAPLKILKPLRQPSSNQTRYLAN